MESSDPSSTFPSFPQNPAPSLIPLRKDHTCYTGMRGQIQHHSRGWQNFTIRHDYDFAQGMAGKGYHVNVELPGEKVAYVKRSAGE